MKSMIQSIATHLCALYLGAGLFGGLLMAQAIPAMNGFGITWYAVTWPAQIYCARIERGCDPLPERLTPWMFSFEEASQ